MGKSHGPGSKDGYVRRYRRWLRGRLRWVRQHPRAFFRRWRRAPDEQPDFGF